MRGSWLVMVVSVGFVLACTGEVTLEGPEDAAHDVVVAEPAPAPAPAAAAPVLVGLTAGDVACYAELSEGGSNRSVMADFAVCPGGDHDASALIGKPVAVTTRPEKVMADSCQGNPDCTDSQTVDLIVTITGT